MEKTVIRFETNSTQAKAVINFVRQRDEFTKSLQKKAIEIANAKNFTAVQPRKVR